MFWNYLVTALRGVVRHKLYSFINIAGLALGLACVTFIVLFIRDETSYDRWVPGSSQLYRLELTANVPGRPPVDLGITPFPLAAAMRDQIPEVTAATRVRRETMTLIAGDRQFFETVDVVDPDFLKVIGLPLISGEAAQALSHPESLIISQDTARKYFGDGNTVGRTVRVARTGCAEEDTACQAATLPLEVTGVLRNLPQNSQLLADVILPNTSSADRASEESKQDWLSANYYAYVALAPGSDPNTVLTKLRPILDTAAGGALRARHLNVRGSDLLQVHMTPFTDVHLQSARYTDNMTPAGDCLLELPGLDWKTGPASTITGATIINMLRCETARLLVERGHAPVMLPSHQFVGNVSAEEQLERFYEAYRKSLGHLYE